MEQSSLQMLSHLTSSVLTLHGKALTTELESSIFLYSVTHSFINGFYELSNMLISVTPHFNFSWSYSKYNSEILQYVELRVGRDTTKNCCNPD